MTSQKMLLAGDVGGTKTTLALYSHDAGPRRPLAVETFPSNAYPDLESVARTFLKARNAAVASACFGVAGPVRSGKAETTNLPWCIEAKKVASTLGIPRVFLLNDLEATANAIPYLEKNDLVDLSSGTGDPGGVMAVIAPGTGLGQAFLLPTASGFSIRPSEGGHADFAPRTPREDALLAFLRQTHGHVSYERVCSGMGIAAMYSFVQNAAPNSADQAATEIAAALDPTPIIVAAAQDSPQANPHCAAALDMFVDILAAEAGNLFLKVLATGGVFIGGGIPPRIIELLKGPGFLQTFRHKGRMAPLLADAPVRVIVAPDAALFGAACYLFAKDRHEQ